MAAGRLKFFRLGCSGTDTSMISEVESNLGFGRGGSRSTSMRWVVGMSRSLGELVRLPCHDERATISLIVRHEIPRQLACYREKPLARFEAVEVQVLVTNEGQRRANRGAFSSERRPRSASDFARKRLLWGASWGRYQRKDAYSTRDHAAFLITRKNSYLASRTALGFVPGHAERLSSDSTLWSARCNAHGPMLDTTDVCVDRLQAIGHG